MKCPKCLQDYDDSFNYCPHCREPHPDKEKLQKCPYCAEWVKEEAVVCRVCGKPLPKQYQMNQAQFSNYSTPEPRPSGPSEEVESISTARLFGILGITFVVAVMAIAGNVWNNKLFFVIWQVVLWTGLAFFLCCAFGKTRVFFIITVPVTILILVLFIVGAMKGHIGFYWWLITPCILAIACSIMGVIMGEGK